jgi:hypothetical protein
VASSPRRTISKKGGAPIPPCSPSFATRNSDLHDLDEQYDTNLQRDACGRVVAFTDGSAIFPEDPRRRRAAWGVYYAPSHPWNQDGPVHLDSQTVYAAELMAAVHVAVSATAPTLIVSDCRAVVDQLRAEIEGDNKPIRGDYADLRLLLRRAIQARPSDFFDAEWVKSHTDPADAAEAEMRGGAPAAYVHGNGQADLLAKEAMRWHSIDQAEYDKAEDREFLAMVIQGLLETLWSNIFDRDVNLRGLEDHAADLHDGQIQVDADDDGPGDADDGEEQGPQARDPLSLPNQQLAAFVKKVSPNYCWGDSLGELETETITFPDLPHYVSLHRRASTLVAGRGMVNVSFALPTYYADAVRWWLNNLRWPTTGAVVGLPSPWTSATYLECVVDMELSTGFRLGLDGACETTWAAKAKTLYYIVRTLARIHTINVGDGKGLFKSVLSPLPSVSALSPLGAPVQAGFARRPIWACPHTPDVVAANVWRARAAETRARATGASTSAAARARTFAHDWTVTYSGYPAQDRWRAQSAIDLEAAIARTIREKEKRPPSDRRPSDQDAVKRRKTDKGDLTTAAERPSPSHPPPAMTREFKRARINEPPSQEHDVAVSSTLSSAPSSSTTGASSSTNGLCTGIQAKKRGKTSATWEDDSIRCAACSGPTSFALGRPLPLPPWLPEPWNGARPGSIVCKGCYHLFGTTYTPP